MSLRVSLDFKGGYFKINREERNLAAIFYHTLLLNDNLNRFVTMVGCDDQILEVEMGIYFEYAFIRDLWKNISAGNEFKRKLILNLLQPNNRNDLENMSVLEFNRYFGAVRTPSSEYIASPSNWSIKYYNDNIPDNYEFLKVCKFKWCFNAKPDIVINTSHNTAICIEAKYESNEGKYPSDDSEKKIFEKRDLDLVGQLSIQKKLMEEILGIKTHYVFLVQKKSSSLTHSTYTWKEIFDKLDTDSCPYFIKEWLKRL
jgi:hypothetical protein